MPRASREPRMLEGAIQKKFKIHMNLWSFVGKERLRSKTNQSQPEWEKKRQTRRAQKKALALPSRELEDWTAKQVSESSLDQDFFLFGTVWRARRRRGLLPPRLFFLDFFFYFSFGRDVIVHQKPPLPLLAADGKAATDKHSGHLHKIGRLEVERTVGKVFICDN